MKLSFNKIFLLVFFLVNTYIYISTKSRVESLKEILIEKERKIAELHNENEKEQQQQKEKEQQVKKKENEQQLNKENEQQIKKKENEQQPHNENEPKIKKKENGFQNFNEEMDKIKILSKWSNNETEYYSKVSCLGIDLDTDIVSVERRSCIFENVCLDLYFTFFFIYVSFILSFSQKQAIIGKKSSTLKKKIMNLF